MNELELKKLWNTVNEQREEFSRFNKINAENTSRLQVHSWIHSMKPLKKVTLAVGLLWVATGTFALSNIYQNGLAKANLFFVISATIQIVLTAIALGMYLHQFIKIEAVNTFDTILETQEKLGQIRISTLASARVLMLQLPVWTTFWWNNSMVANWNTLQWSITLSVTCLATYASIWLFCNIKYENRNKKWFQRIFKGKEWTPLMKSMELLEQVKEYK